MVFGREQGSLDLVFKPRPYRLEAYFCGMLVDEAAGATGGGKPVKTKTHSSLKLGGGMDVSLFYEQTLDFLPSRLRHQLSEAILLLRRH